MTSQSEALSMNTAFWEKAYRDNFDALCARARRRLTNGNSFEAEDMVSEAFVRVMRYAPNPEAIRNVVPYMWTVVRRVWAAEKVRPSNARTESLEDLDSEEIERLPSIRVEPEVLAILERDDFLYGLKLRAGPMTLAETTLLELRLDGCSLEEIAAVLDEDVKRTRFRWYKFVARQRYRLNKEKARAQSAGN